MKKVLLLIVAVLPLVLCQKVYAQISNFHFDFSDTCSTGQELFYKIIDPDNHYVALVNPSYFSTYESAGYPSPTGYVNIPNIVYHNSIGYTVKALGGTGNGSHLGGIGAFFRCQSLTSVTIPSTVTYIGDAAFAHDTSLISITIPPNCTGIGTEAFFGCKNLTDLTIFSSVVFAESGGALFTGCTGLVNLTIDNPWILNAYFKSYDDSYQLHNLQNINTYPCCTQHYSSINGVLFDLNQDTLVRYPMGRAGAYTIPDGVSVISRMAFYNCRRLYSITIPSSVDLIQLSAFSRCDSLNLIVMEDSVPPLLDGDPFYMLSTDVQIQVPCGSIPIYRADTIWSRFTNYISDTACVSYNIHVTTNDSLMGIVSGGGEGLPFGSNATIYASPNTGYQFLSWSDGDTNNPRIIMITQDSSFAALFSHITYNVNASVLPSDLNPGSISISGNHYYMEYDTIIANNNYGYHFVRWSDGKTSNPRLLLITSDTTISAVFDKDHFYVSANTLPSEYYPGCFVFGNGIYSYLDTATLYAIPQAGMSFIRWTDNNIENPRNFVVTSSISIGAVFSQSMSDTIVLFDTTYVDIYVHDTSYVNVYVHDTTTIVDTVTLMEYVPVIDTSYIDVYVHDTTTIIDTVTLTEYVPVHDTTIVSLYDTTYITIHDTTYITQTDTVTNTMTIYDTITNTVIDTVTNTIYDTTIIYSTDTIWLHDTVFVHDTIFSYDTIYVGVDEVETISAKIYPSNGQIVVDGTHGNPVWLFDVNGRILDTKQDEYLPLHFDVPTSGTYIVKISNHPARKVVVIK